MAIERSLFGKRKKPLYFVRLPDVNLNVAGYNGAGREGVTEASSELDAVGHVAARFTHGGRIGLVSCALDNVSRNGRAEFACLVPEIDDKYSDGTRIPAEDLRWLREFAFAKSLALYAGKGEDQESYIGEARRIFNEFRID